MHIEKDNDKQAFTSPYCKPPIQKLAQDKVCAELLLLGFIEPAPSAQHAANPVVALKKGPDGQYTANRVCYNYKAINLLTKDMHTCFPIAEELFQDLGDSKWFTRVDLRSSFYQVHMSAGCQDFSAFWWDKQLYRFKRVPFGLKQAPAFFQKVMETELGKRGLLKFSKVFIDDILVHSATFAEHIKHVEAVLQCLIDIGLRIHSDKSCFALDTVDFLGFDVSNHGLPPQAAKVQAIKDLPYPNNLKDLKTILGAVLGQLDSEGNEYLVACASRTLNKHEARPGAQHGNADALSRFPSPTAADNTGARIDLDSDLYAAFPTVPTPPYAPLDLTLGHIVDYILDVLSCLIHLHNTPACRRLEAALRNGIQVNRYIYSDIAPAAQTAAHYRTQALTNLYSHLLKSYACDHAFTTLPQDVTKITPEQLMTASVNDQSQWLIIAGPECQDFSPARGNRRLKGPRAAVLQACTTVIGTEHYKVPVEDWFCPNCKASGITAIPAGRTPEAPQKEPNLFPTPQTRSKEKAALAYDKMLVIKLVRVQGGLDKAVWGTASFQGPLSRPWYFKLTYDDGQVIKMIYFVSAHATMVTSITTKAMSSNSPLNLSNSSLHAFTSSKLPGSTSKLT
eukprot:gene25867-biopygen20359